MQKSYIGFMEKGVTSGVGEADGEGVAVYGVAVVSVVPKRVFIAEHEHKNNAAMHNADTAVMTRFRPSHTNGVLLFFIFGRFLRTVGLRACLTVRLRHIGLRLAILGVDHGKLGIIPDDPVEYAYCAAHLIGIAV